MFDGDDEDTDDNIPMDSSNEFKKTSYGIIKDIHTNDDSPYIALWEKIRNLSLGSYASIFERLGINQLIMGESFYKPFIPELISETISKGMSEVKDGRVTIKADKSVPPLTIVKSDGAYTYATTDLTAVKYRVHEQKADSIYYVVDTGQSSHFKQLFAVSKALGYLDKTEAEHLNFGVVLGDDGLRIRSKNGDTPRLIDLLEECIKTTHKVFDERKKHIDDKDCESVAVSSLRYANISICRTSDFMFSPEKMLSFKGDTYMYLLYAYVRCKQIMAKFESCKRLETKLNSGLEDADYKLMYIVLKFPYVLMTVSETKMPHILAAYTYKLVNAIQIHYNNRTLEFDKENNMTSANIDRLKIVNVCEKLLSDIFNIMGLKLLTHV
jgi:arginyl-tRNA synthetase